jgi:hypothetical protein
MDWEYIFQPKAGEQLVDSGLYRHSKGDLGRCISCYVSYKPQVGLCMGEVKHMNIEYNKLPSYVQVGIRSIYIENMSNHIETFLLRILPSLLDKAHLL